jgi:hypothetical protein
MKRQPFTVAEGLQFQAKDLAHWALRLNGAYIAAVAAEAVRQNADLPTDADGYDVWRGNDLSNFIANTHLKP